MSLRNMTQVCSVTCGFHLWCRALNWDSRNIGGNCYPCGLVAAVKKGNLNIAEEIAEGFDRSVKSGLGGSPSRISRGAILRWLMVLELVLRVDFGRLSSKSPPFRITSSKIRLPTSTMPVLLEEPEGLYENPTL